MKKSYFQINTPNGPSSAFMRHAYQLLTPSSSKGSPNTLTGDESAAVNFNHGNSVKHLTRPHIRTCPSVLRSLEKECKHTTTAKVYRSHITQVPPPTHTSVLQPRSKKQVKNARCLRGNACHMILCTTSMNWPQIWCRQHIHTLT